MNKLAGNRLPFGQRRQPTIRPTLTLARTDTTCRPLANGGRRPVLLAQNLLARLGYDPGSRDGLMRPLLRRAIRAYQLDFGQVATGRMTRRLIQELRASLREEGKTALVLP